MGRTLQEPTSRRSPSWQHAVRDIVPARTLVAALLARSIEERGEASFELESHGGYARVVSGAVEYVDTEAETLLVRTAAGERVRVPLRDVISVRSSDGHDEHRFERDSEGLGSGHVALGGWPSARGGPA